MSHGKDPDPFVHFTVGCVVFIGMYFTVCGLVVWLAPW